MNQSERKKYSDEFIRINRLYEKKYFQRVQKALKGKVSSLIAALREGGYQAGISYLNTDLGNVQLSKVVESLYREVGLRHARKTYRFLKVEEGRKSFGHFGGGKTLPLTPARSLLGDPFRKESDMSGLDPRPLAIRQGVQTKAFGFNAQWLAFILNYLQEFLLDKITFQVSSTTRDKLLQVIQQGQADGIGIDAIVDQLEKLPFTRYQAARIVRTETNRAANVGTMAAVDTSEYLMQKEWISAQDIRTRGTNPKDHADHVHLNGKVVDYGEKFKDQRSGSELEFPGDPEGKPEDVIFCRCCVAPLVKRDSNGQLMKKPQAAIPMIGLRRTGIAAQPNIGLTVTN